MNRKSFLLNTLTGSAALLTPTYLMSQTKPVEPYNKDIVKDFVAAGHNNLGKVKSMLAEYPNLLYARHDGVMVISKKQLKGQGMLGIGTLLIT